VRRQIVCHSLNAWFTQTSSGRGEREGATLNSGFRFAGCCSAGFGPSGTRITPRLTALCECAPEMMRCLPWIRQRVAAAALAPCTELFPCRCEHAVV
jgi:hypothetical protein